MDKKEIENLNGFLLIDKPKNCTSYDCIRHIKKIIKQKTKIGHTGTLDDFATGLLIICIGRSATKLSGKLLNMDKQYIVTAKLGELTDSLDKTGNIIDTQDATKLSEADITSAIEKLGTCYNQIPPIYSALKHKGKPLYKLARQNKLKEAEIDEILKHKCREVTIHHIELTEWNNPFFTLKTTVSKGTYIRSLTNDIAQLLLVNHPSPFVATDDMPSWALGLRSQKLLRRSRLGLQVNATTYELQRTEIGPFSLTNAVSLHDIRCLEDIQENIISTEKLTNLVSL